MTGSDNNSVVAEGPGTSVEPPQWWVYLIVNAVGRTYVGATKGPSAERRLQEHNGNRTRAARSTRGRGPWILAYVEPAEDKSAALSREWHLKRDRRLRRELAAAALRQLQNTDLQPRTPVLIALVGDASTVAVELLPAKNPKPSK